MGEHTAEKAQRCGEHYGSNPDPCHRPAGHEGAHSNQWGTTWASKRQWVSRMSTPPGERT